MSGLIGVVLGLVVGGAAAGTFTTLSARRSQCPDPASHQLTDQDREAVAAEFAAHVEATRRNVSEYADALAGEDSALRQLMTAIEHANASLGRHPNGGQ